MEASQTRVSQSGLKTGGGAMAGGARGTIAKVARSQVEDRRVDVICYVEPCYPCFAIFILLGHRGTVVI
jgi:hypothetical protein